MFSQLVDVENGGEEQTMMEWPMMEWSDSRNKIKTGAFTVIMHVVKE